MPKGTIRVFGVASAVLIFAVVGAAVSGPWTMEPRNFDWPAQTQAPKALPSQLQGPPSGQATPDYSPRSSDGLDLSWLGIALAIFGAVGVGVLLWWLWKRYRNSALEEQEALGVQSTTLIEEVPDVPILHRGVKAAQRSLDEIADPNNAIVAAWLALEEAAASSGVRRDRAETPTEFTVDVLSRTKADPAATRQLLRLYHRARFSATGVTPADVTEASRCLGVLAASWKDIDLAAALDRGEAP